jgi:NHL repeat
MMRAGRLASTALATLGVLAGGLALSAAPALAATGYGFTGSFGSEGSGNGQFKEPSGVAVNDATGDVYVVDKGNSRVQWFDSTGKFEGQFDGSGTPAASFSAPEGIAVDNGTLSPSHGDVYVADVGNKVIDKFSTTGAYESQLTGFGTLLGIAVDPSGDLFVYEAESTVYEYSATGALLQRFATQFGTTTPGLAVDSSDDLYTNFGGSSVLKFEPVTGSFLRQLEDGAVSALTIDAATNNLFVDRAGSILEYGPFGEPETPVREFGSKVLADNGGSGIAVSATGTGYVADSVSDKVDTFAEGPTPEAPLTEEAKKVTATTAVLHGELTPPTAKLEYHFEYNLGTSCTGGSRTSGEEGEGKVSQEVTGLEPSAQYTFCFVSENAFGPTLGPPERFTTAPAPPQVDGESASGATSTSATLEAQVNPNNQETTYSFEYSTTETAGTLDPPIVTVNGASPLTAGFGDQSAAVSTAAVLAPGTTYYYRVLATNERAETTAGEVKSFATVPTPFTDPAGPIGATTATLNGHFTLNGQVATQYHFLYRLGSACTGEGEVATSTEEAGTGATVASETAAVTGLEPNAEYTVCFVTSNQFGSESTPPVPPVHFTTLPAPPSVEGESAAAVPSETTPAAGLVAQVNPNNQETTCHFEYATEESVVVEGKGASAPCGQGTLNGFGAQTATAHVENLQAGATYYYRAVAENTQSRLEGKPAEGTIEHFTALIAPTVATGAAQEPTRTSILLTGMVDPNGLATSYHFAYVDEAGYQAALARGAHDRYADGATTTPAQAGEGTAPVEVSVPVGGLLPATTYHYALVAGNQAGTTITGADETFTTTAATPPLVTTAAASEVTLSTATISGTVNTQGLNVSYAFEVSTDPANPGPPSGGGSIGAGSTEATVSVALQGLRPGTTYYYRLLATSTDGTGYGELESFTTLGFPSPLIQPATPPLIGTPNVAFPTGNQENTQSPSIEVVKHSVKGTTATIKVSVPSAGRLVATGKGVSKGMGKASKAGDVTVKVSLTKGEAALLAKHKGRKLRVGVKLTFTPTTGSQLMTTTTVLIG